MKVIFKKVFAQPRALKLLVAGLVVTGLAAGFVYFKNSGPPPTGITTTNIPDVTSGVKITSSLNRAVSISDLQAKPHETIKLESKELPIKQPRANAVSFEWSQQGDEGIDLQVRTKKGREWTPWVSGLQNDDRKDGDDMSKASTLVLAQEIKEFQYRFVLSGESATPSALINLTQAELTAIDSNNGPTGVKKNKSLLEKLGGVFSPTKSVNALADGPRIISRAEWGSPEPNGSPRWEPEYYPLGRAIIHHTVSTETPNSFAAVRAIWDFHANGRGWGDIGYNYLVDSSGNVFQGRYFDTTHALMNKVEVEAGHTLGENKGTIGIAAIGNFQTNLVPSPVLSTISNLIAFRFAPYNLNPNGNGPFNGPTVTGHRDLGSTACPGFNLYNQIPNIRVWASQKAPRYASMHKLDYQYVSQGLYLNGSPVNASNVFKPEDTAELAINVRNFGVETWTNSGSGAVRLGTTNPTDRVSQFYDSSWIGKNRASSFTGKVTGGTVEPASEIKYGEVAQFRFKLKIPEISTSAGSGSKSFNEHFNLLIDGRTWFARDLGIYQSLNVATRSYVWQWQGQSLYTDETKSVAVNPRNLQRNQRYYAVVQVKNVGTAVWNNNSLKLGTSNPGDRSSIFFDSTWLAPNRPARLANTSLSPGQTGAFEFWIKTPLNAVAKNEDFRPVVENVTWLNDLGLYYRFEAP